MNFFSSVPRPEEPPWPRQPPVPEWMAPPTGQLPAVVPLGWFLYRSDQTAIAVESARVYSTGAALDIRWAHRRGDRAENDWRPLMPGRRPFPPGDDENELRLGIQFPDGTKAVADNRPPRGGTPLARPETPVLRTANRQGTGGHDETSGLLTLWMWPLPTEGTHRLVTEWRDAGVPESSVEFEGSLLQQAVARVQFYWADNHQP